MKPATLSLAAALLLAVPVVTGCAGEEAEAGDASYPVGYTPPGDRAAAQPTAPPGARSPAPVSQRQAAQTADPSGAWQWAPPEDETADDGAAGAEGGEPPADDGGGYADSDPSALSDFRSTLEPYGAWTDDPDYGTVWVPSSSVVGSDFTPYVTAGHWAYDTDYAWVSDYDWGWAPFHYGRWVYASGPGWEWIPGRVYAGAWVSWRYGVDDWAYVGWAPLAPTWCWRGGVAVGLGYVPRAPYAFVGTGELFAPRIGPRVVGGAQVGAIASHTRPYVPGLSPGGARVAARPMVGGPSPAALHIAPDAVASSAEGNRGLTQARAFARPATAVALGARAPRGMAARPTPAAFSRGGATPVAGYRSQAIATPSQFEGRRFGGGFAGSATAAAPVRSYPSYGGAAPMRSYPSYGGAAPTRSYPSYGGAAPTRSYPSYGGAAPTRSYPSYSSARPYFGSSSPSGAFRGSSVAPPSYSAPSALRSSPSVGAFRTAPGASGFGGAASSGAFRGGGATGGFHGVPSGGGFESGGFHGGGGARSGGHR